MDSLRVVVSGFEEGMMRADAGLGESNTMKQPSKRVALVALEGTEATCTAAMLIQLGWETTVVSTWREAERSLGQHHFDVMVTDYHLAGGDGFDLISAWREREIRLRVLFLADTAIPSSVPVEEFGFCGLLVRPFSRAELKTALTRVLRLKGAVDAE